MSAAYIFDVEGTLIDCAPETLQCWHETLAGFGVPVPLAHLQRLSGMDSNDMLGVVDMAWLQRGVWPVVLWTV